MDFQELLRKLDQIEQQAKLTLDEFPKHLTKERLRMIIALVAYLKTQASLSPLFDAEQSKPEESASQLDNQAA